MLSLSAAAAQRVLHNRGMAAPQVIAIFGPTASGKSAVADELAVRIPAEIVSADSMQVYRGLPILTNQPASPTKLVAIWDLETEASVAEYQRLAHAAIDEIVASGRAAVVVGGTGLYLRAALSSLELPPPPEPGARERWQIEYDRLGPDSTHRVLAERDPAAAARVHPNDRRRVVRALELTELGRSLKPSEDTLWTEQTRRPTAIFGLDVPADALEGRIRERTRAMFAAGVDEEVRSALASGISSTARKALGLDEIARLPADEAVEAIVVRTRSYAAYQRKWMRRIPGLVTVAADRPPGEIADEILELARPRQRLSPRRGRVADA
jgi:tRNA dimethylallyltransferase